MTYGTIKVDTVTFTDAGIDKSVTLSGLVQNPTFSGNVTVTGTLSGVTVTGTTANFTSGNFTNISGGTHTITSGVFAAGSAASPSITFTGDLNTGIYSPGADQVAISTGGSGRLFVDANGNIAVGTSATSNFGATARSFDINSAGGIANLYVKTGTVNGGLQADAGNGYMQVWTASNHPIAFNIAFSEKMRLDTSGRLGVGTSSPSEALTVAGNIRANNTNATIGAYGANSSSPQLVLGNSAGTIHYSIYETIDGSGNRGNLNIFDNVGSANRLTIDSSGRVGVGTTSPSANLHIGNGTASADIILDKSESGGAALRFWKTGALSAYIQCDGSEDLVYSSGSANHVFYSGGVIERVRIDSSGRVGIGTSSPTEILDCKGNIVLGAQNAAGASLQPTSASGTNIAGSALILRSGRSTGSGSSGLIQILPSAGSTISGTAVRGDSNSGFHMKYSPSSWNDHPSLGLLTVVLGSSIAEANRSGLAGDATVFTIDGCDTASQTALEIVAANNGADGDQGLIRFYGSGSKNPYATIVAVTPGIDYTSGNLAIRTYNAGVEGTVATFTNTGRLGIGTTSPSSLFHVDTVTNATAITVAASTSTGGQLRIGTGGATAGNQSILSTGNGLDIGTTIGSPITFFTNGTANERLRIDSSGRVGIGTSSPSTRLHVVNDIEVARFSATSASTVYATWQYGTSTSVGYVGNGGLLAAGNASDFVVRSDAALAFAAGGSTERLRIDSSGRVGIGTTSPQADLHIGNADGASRSIVIHTTNNGDARLRFREGSTVGSGYNEYSFGMAGNANAMTWESQGLGEIGRWDSSGRLLVGTSTSRGNNFNLTGQNMRLQVEGTDYLQSGASFTSNSNTAGEGPHIAINRSRGTTVGSNTVVQDGDRLGLIAFQGNDGAEFVIGASIDCLVDGTPGANDMPGRLVFSTTADGASSPTERMRITSGGSVFIGKTSGAGQGNVLGIDLGTNQGQALFVTGSTSILYLNRNTDDGDLVRFAQGGTDEGTISVSGTTVSYNGAHLSRWSQLPSGSERTEILRGTVLSNIDEMCEWGDEDNEQLNRMKVSDVEGDKNVAGVFQAWDDDDDTYTNDFYCAMTGDFIIRIGAGVTVERGDLLMSAGDGTAKPQDDDIIRSKTIAKVTSTNVSCTYDDGSYCVPCVLMAC